MLNNIKTVQKNRGFTIVELLIVIVVIGILAAITIVAYGNITTQANANAAKANAANVAKVAEAYNADDSTPGGYPTQGTITSYSGISRVPSGITVSTTNPTAANGKTTVGYAVTTGNAGACVSYWNYSKAGGAGLDWTYAGNGRTGGGLTNATATCSSS